MDMQGNGNARCESFRDCEQQITRGKRPEKSNNINEILLLMLIKNEHLQTQILLLKNLTQHTSQW